MEILPLGDSALLVRLPKSLAEPEAVARELLALRQRIEELQFAGLCDVVPAYTTLGIFYDPARTPYEILKGKLEEALAVQEAARDVVAVRQVEIPVSYDPEFAPDLEAVAQHTGLSAEEVVRRHSAAEYIVSCVGFTPGFAYLSGLPPELATPRRATPRKEVPAGAVAIGGPHTGVYPQVSPGGWNIIGRTPLRFFDLEQTPPALLRTGDRVRFRQISPEELDVASR